MREVKLDENQQTLFAQVILVKPAVLKRKKNDVLSVTCFHNYEYYVTLQQKSVSLNRISCNLMTGKLLLEKGKCTHLTFLSANLKCILSHKENFCKREFCPKANSLLSPLLSSAYILLI